MKMKVLVFVGRSHLALLALSYAYACWVWVSVAAKLLAYPGSSWLDVTALLSGLAVVLLWFGRVALDLARSILACNSKVLNPYIHFGLFIVSALVLITSLFFSNLQLA